MGRSRNARQTKLTGPSPQDAAQAGQHLVGRVGVVNDDGRQVELRHDVLVLAVDGGGRESKVASVSAIASG
jgi:hypothetical protein